MGKKQISTQKSFLRKHTNPEIKAEILRRASRGSDAKAQDISLRRESNRDTSLRKAEIARERNTVYGIGFFEKIKPGKIKKSKKEKYSVIQQIANKRREKQQMKNHSQKPTD